MEQFQHTMELSRKGDIGLLADRNVLITGASRGLGESLAREFWAVGANLLLVARGAGKLEVLQRTLLSTAGAGQTVAVFSADLADATAPASILTYARSIWSRLDVLVNNAAIVGPIGKFWDNDAADWNQTLQVNLLSPVELMRGAIPWMPAGSAIVNLSGGGATGPRPNFSAYGTAKAALVRLSETVAVEAEPLGVRVNCVAPGAMNTEMLEAVLRTTPEAAGGEYAKSLQQKEKGGSDPAIAARLCVHLATDATRGVTGRLFSAVWDPWQHLEELAPALAGSDIYTLRRIVPADRGKDWETRDWNQN